MKHYGDVIRISEYQKIRVAENKSADAELISKEHSSKALALAGLNDRRVASIAATAEVKGMEKARFNTSISGKSWKDMGRADENCTYTVYIIKI